MATLRERILAKSTAGSPNTNRVHMLSACPGGSGPGTGINAAMPHTGAIVLSGWSPSFDSQLAPLLQAGALRFTGQPPTFVNGGPAVVAVSTGAIQFVEYPLPAVLSPERSEVVAEEYRYEGVPVDLRYEVVEYQYRYLRVANEWRYERINKD